MSKSGAYVAPNSRKKEPITSLNTESAKEFPGLKIGTEVTKKPAPISFAALLKKKEETKEHGGRRLYSEEHEGAVDKEMIDMIESRDFSFISF